MEKFDTWGLTHDIVCPQFCPCFSFRLLAFPVSVLVSQSSAPQIPNIFTPCTLRNVAECTVNPVLLCHIQPTAHVHILCVWWKCRIWCLFKMVCSWVQHLPAHAHIFFSWQILGCSIFSLLSHAAIHWGTVFNKLFPSWTLMEDTMLCDQDCISAASWVPATAWLQTQYCRASGKLTSTS